MDFYYTEKRPVSAETWPKTSCSYSLRSHKVNPLKKKRVHFLLEETESRLNEWPNDRTRTNSILKGPVSAETWPKTSCSYSLRSHKVAIKYLLKGYVDYFTLPGDTHSLPHEGVLMELVSKPRCSPFVIKQLEWFKTAAGFLLIMEQPHSFITLGKFRKGLKGRMSEDVARIITRKIIQALIHCRDNGVIHGDIKEANILLNPETLDLKLIDFGRARLIYRRLYKFGVFPIPLPSRWVSEFYPWELSSTVRGLGSLLYTLTCGKNIPNNPLPLYIGGLSKACSMLTHGCLHKDIEKLPFYELILWDKWSQVKDPSTGHKNKKKEEEEEEEEEKGGGE
ncbi:serine/threonine-protein kinase DCLK3-like isoform X2 [Tachysurus ichikawai]